MSGRKNNHQQVDPGSGVHTPSLSTCFFISRVISNYLLPNNRLPVTVFLFPGINKVILFVTTVQEQWLGVTFLEDFAPASQAAKDGVRQTKREQKQ